VRILLSHEERKLYDNLFPIALAAKKGDYVEAKERTIQHIEEIRSVWAKWRDEVRQ
jgi:hypothetical protein